MHLKVPLCSERDYSLIECHGRLGLGSQAEVFKGACGRQVVALKVFNGGRGEYTKDNKPEQNKTAYLKEYHFLSRLSAVGHANIVQLLGTTEVMNHGTLVLEYLPESLSESLKAHKPVPLHQRLIQLCDIAEGTCFLNRQGFLHLDMKTNNVMLTVAGRCKLIDFGLTEALSPPLMRKFSPPSYYIAPELSGVWAQWRAGALKNIQRDRVHGHCTVVADGYGLGLITAAVVYEDNAIRYTWDLDGDNVIEFQTLEQGGMPHYLSDSFLIQPITYQGHSNGPFANKEIRDNVKGRLVYPAMTAAVDQRMPPEQFLVAARACYASYCQPREPEQSSVQGKAD